MTTERTTINKAESIDLYLEDQEYHGKSERTLQAYERVLTEFESHLRMNTQGNLETATRRGCMQWVHSLRGDLAPSTIASYASYVNRFYAYMVEIGEFEHNPMSLVLAEMSESIDTDPVRRDISIADMREFLTTIAHPLDRAVIITFLKTGIRVGELCNLDIRDITLNHSPAYISSIGRRGALEGRNNALFVDNTPQRGNILNGEERTASNKRKRATIIPIDDELAHVLRQWLIIRPDAVSEAEPLFLDTNEQWGHRLSPDTIRYRIRKYTSQINWHERHGDATDNVTPHYFRHFFTTHLRDRTGDRGIVKYLRGDVADDIIETYTHNWGDRVKTGYEQHIYSLL